MRIAQVSTVGAPVRREGGGSIESLVWVLTRELARLGHEVTVFGVAGSEVAGELVAALPGPYGAPGSLDEWELCEWVNLCRAVEESGRFDVLHSHAYLWGLPLQRLARAPMVHTLHIVPDADHARLRRLAAPTCVTATSRHQWSAWPDLAPAAIVPHGLDLSQFDLSERPGEHLCWLGRFTREKGALEAIAVARALGRPIVLAGPPNAWFHEHVEPLVDGRDVRYAGLVDAAGRSRLLGGARALVYPILAPEAFGLVLVEAMLCGTPVAAIRLGAVAEIVEEGVTGFSVPAVSELAKAVTRCSGLDRRRVREAAERRFSADRMARDYVRVYESLQR